jgi:uncharacterized membrane protein YgdD (TMEM256/DUF423 family)
VGIGTIGEHVLRGDIASESMRFFMTALRYHQLHAIALLALAGIHDVNGVVWPAGFWLAGMVFFCGAIYASVMFSMPVLQNLAPIGGISFMLGWGSLIVLAIRG